MRTAFRLHSSGDSTSTSDNSTRSWTSGASERSMPPTRPSTSLVRSPPRTSESPGPSPGPSQSTSPDRRRKGMTASLHSCQVAQPTYSPGRANKRTQLKRAAGSSENFSDSDDSIDKHMGCPPSRKALGLSFGVCSIFTPLLRSQIFEFSSYEHRRATAAVSPL